ncbi:PAS domain-containing protein, partial [Streptomyces prunicolor]|uniref:PAS domain-containing protein n=1 Tax=Streptomyces prunicolor TaxID=67348 RepID=UPI0033F5F965
SPPRATSNQIVLPPGPSTDPQPASEGDSAADLLPDGVFCLDRLGLVTYANPRAAQLLGRPREELLGRPLWEGVPWLNQIGCEDQLRGALLSLGPVHFHVRRPDEPEQEQREGRSEGRAQESYASDWLAMAVHPGRDGLTCTVAPSTRVAGPPLPLVPVHADGDGGPANGVTSLAPLYRPIVLAIALTEAVTARQVSAVVMKELLPAFGGRRLAIYLLQERHLYLAWETGFPQGFLAPFDGVGLDTRLPGVETLTTGRPLFFDSMQQGERLRHQVAHDLLARVLTGGLQRGDPYGVTRVTGRLLDAEQRGRRAVQPGVEADHAQHP